MVYAFLDKGLDQRFTPSAQHLPIKSTTEAAHTGKPGSVDFNGAAVKKGCTDTLQNGLNFSGLPGFKIMIAQDRNDWNPDMSSKIYGNSCNGTLLSKIQYLSDVTSGGLLDAREEARCQMTLAEIQRWTAAAGNR